MADLMPDLSHLSAEERKIIEEVFMRQRAEEEKETQIAEKADKELEDIDRQINERKDNALKLVGTQDDAICQICQKTKFADGIGHKCFYCQLRSCARCGGRTTNKNKTIWACSLCQKRQQILAKTGKWFQLGQTEGEGGEVKATTPAQRTPTSETAAPFPQQQRAAQLASPSPTPPSSASRTPQPPTTQSRPNTVAQSSLPSRASQPSSQHPRPVGNGLAQQRPQPTPPNQLPSSSSTQPQSNHVDRRPPPDQQTRRQNTLQRQSTLENEARGRRTPPDQRHMNGQDDRRPVDSRDSRRSPPDQYRSDSSRNRYDSRDSGADYDRDRNRSPTSSARRPPPTRDDRDRDRDRDRVASPTDRKASRARDDPYSRRSEPVDDRQDRRSPGPYDRERGGDYAKRNEQSERYARDSGGDAQYDDRSSRKTSSFDSRPPEAVRPPRNRDAYDDSYERERNNQQRTDQPRDDDADRNRRERLRKESLARKRSSDRPDERDTRDSAAIGGADYRLADSRSPPLADEQRRDPPVTSSKTTYATRNNANRQGELRGKGNSHRDTLPDSTGSRAKATGPPSTHHHPPTTRHRKSRLSRQYPSLSSSEEELPSTSECHSCDDVRVETESEYSSEKGDVESKPRRYRDEQVLAAKIKNKQLLAAAAAAAQGGIPVVGLPPNPFGPASPMVMVTGPQGSRQQNLLQGHAQSNYGISMSSMVDPYAPAQPLLPSTKGQIFGRIEMSLYYSRAEHQLVVTVHQAVDIPPRPDGSPRNPYVKMFLLPDRSERSRRQSNVLAGTLTPVWQQPFIYQGLPQATLVDRVLEVTVWDYDKYETNAFLGETLIDFSSALLNNEPVWYTLVDMDDESPLRARVRQRRLSGYAVGGPHTGVATSRTELPPATQAIFNRYGSAYAQSPSNSITINDMNQRGYRSDRDVSGLGPRQMMSSTLHDGMSRSRTYHRGPHAQVIRQDDDDDWGAHFGASSGYLSDNCYSSQGLGYQRHRRPRSAAAMRPPRDLNPSSPTDQTATGLYDDDARRNLPCIPSDLWGKEAMAELDDQAARLRQQGYGPRVQPPRPTGSNGRRRQRALPFDPTSPGEYQTATGTGYGSDGSETSMSVHSSQSMPSRRGRGHNGQSLQQYQNSLETAPEEDVEYPISDMMDGTMSDSAVGSKSSVIAMKDRKKSIMTRLIPGRGGAQVEGKKRLGFPRSEEVGIPHTLQSAFGQGSPGSSVTSPSSVGGIRHPREAQLLQTRQHSSESGGSADGSWLPLLPDGPLGTFVDDLGPGQVVGRQVLASPVLGEIQIGIVSGRNGIDVEIIRAKNLVVKQGAKMNPAPYVKVYLMEGKQCIAKAKTQSVRRTVAPLFQQHLAFQESPRGRMLQVTVWGEYGRMERKSFMGIAQIRLDDLDLSTSNSIGWYKLYHSSSLVGTTPARKDSESSLPEYERQQRMQQQQQ
uniref:Regulating synaptic membrane exocytosis protein 2 n=1 Tax=Plectus sambesii TaxID=2011161 RepID=A0A914XJE8_9BILA